MPPSYQKVNPSQSPILYFALSSTSLPLSQLDEYAETYLAQRISMVSGVAQVQVYGSQKYAVRIQLDPQALATRGIGIDEVADAVNTGNVNLPTGRAVGHRQGVHGRRRTGSSATRRSSARSSSPIATARPCVCRTSAHVIDGVQDSKVASWFNGQRAHRARGAAAAGDQHGARSRTDVKAAMSQMREPVPGSVTVADALRPVAVDRGSRCTT